MPKKRRTIIKRDHPREGKDHRQENSQQNHSKRDVEGALAPSRISGSRPARWERPRPGYG
jgi:hypothetical protein